MSLQISASPTLVAFSLLAAMALGTQPAMANSPSGFGSAWTVERIRSEAKQGDIVTVEARVVSKKATLFDLRDDHGRPITVVIPNYLQREQGTPRRGETIRVRGAYDHKTFIDLNKKATANPQKTWGIRVTSLERDVETSGRNPAAPVADEQISLGRAAAVPAAPVGAVTIATPTASSELKDRLAAARQRVLAAQRVSQTADAEYARALHQGLEGPEKEALVQRQQIAQEQLGVAKAAIEPLVQEARDAGIDPTLIEMYEAGIRTPGR